MKSPLTPAFEVRVLPIGQLIPAPYNPRKVLQPTDKAYRKLERSLRQFGLVEPLVWNERTGHVVGGHARLTILKAMGVTEVPVSAVSLSDAQEKALNVVLNNLEAQSRYDPSRLAELLDELGGRPELELTGFEQETLQSLRLEPRPEVPPMEEVGDRVRVILEMSAETFDRLAPQLDTLVAQFDLTSHVRRGCR
jgi:ParB-like chromosome segregation protein Spo0J